MSKSGIVNVRMVITEEKILSNIDKVQKLINPNSKKQIIELDEDSYFKELVESVKSYLKEYPKKNNFPTAVYKAAHGLVEFATTQFEENTKKIESLIKQREENIILSGVLKETIKAVEEKEKDWKEKVENVSDKFPEDIIETLNTVGAIEDKESQEYKDSIKLLNARANNLESNLHIEIDMERLEDSSKALSYIGIEVADALKFIPVPEEQIEAVAEQNAVEEKVVKSEIIADVETENSKEENIEAIVENQSEVEEAKEQYVQETTFEAKPSLWQRFKKSKFVRAATYVFRIKVRLELPSNALPEGRGENV